MAKVDTSFLFNEFRRKALENIAKDRQEIISKSLQNGRITSGAIGPLLIEKMREAIFIELPSYIEKLEEILRDVSNRTSLNAINDFEKNVRVFSEGLKNNFIESTGTLFSHFNDNYRDALTRDLNYKYWAHLFEFFKNQFGNLRTKVSHRKNPFWERPLVKAGTYIITAVH